MIDLAAEDDLTMLHPDHLEVLGMVIFQPSRYLQRVVERLSFLPAGGERWQRDIQLRIPTPEKLEAPPDGKFIVSLGMFRRYRFPDFTVTNAAGERLSLVTRRQHQHCITMTSIRKWMDEKDWSRAPKDAEQELLTLYTQMADIITNIKRPSGHSPKDVRASAKAMMEKLGKSERDVERVSSGLMIASELLSLYTHYLCWIPAEPGDTLSISASYTMSDTVRIAGERRKALDPEETGWWARSRSRFYTSLGLYPVPYELRAPAHDHAGSYYLTIEPPEDAHVSMLDWGHDRSLDGASVETDCAYVNCHIHNGDQLVQEKTGETEAAIASYKVDGETEDYQEEVQQESISGAKISAFLRADPIDHAALIAVALLNIGLAWLAQRGEFDNSGDSQQQWLLLAPTLVVALIAQHRRRYYSSVTRSVRITLWIYLAMNALFGASVAFDISGGDKFDDAASASMAVISLALLVLLVASGGLFERMTNRRFRSSPKIETPGAETKDEMDCDDEVNRYIRGVRRYADLTLLAMLVAILAGVVGTQMLDWGRERRDDQVAVHKAEVEKPKSRKPASAPNGGNGSTQLTPAGN